MSSLINESLMDNEKEEVDLTFPDISFEEMNMIVDYCKHYEFNKTATDIIKPLESRDPKVFIKDDWEREFIGKLDIDGKSGLLLAAN